MTLSSSKTSARFSTTIRTIVPASAWGLTANTLKHGTANGLMRKASKPDTFASTPKAAPRALSTNTLKSKFTAVRLNERHGKLQIPTSKLQRKSEPQHPHVIYLALDGWRLELWA